MKNREEHGDMHKFSCLVQWASATQHQIAELGGALHCGEMP